MRAGERRKPTCSKARAQAARNAPQKDPEPRVSCSEEADETPSMRSIAVRGTAMQSLTRTIEIDDLGHRREARVQAFVVRAERPKPPIAPSFQGKPQHFGCRGPLDLGFTRRHDIHNGQRFSFASKAHTRSLPRWHWRGTRNRVRPLPRRRDLGPRKDGYARKKASGPAPSAGQSI